MDIIRTKNIHHNNNSEVGIYKINCHNCSSQYIGETCRNLKKKCIYEYKKDLIHKDLLNALVMHRNKFNHNFNLKNATLIKRESNLGRKYSRVLLSNLIKI